MKRVTPMSWKMARTIAAASAMENSPISAGLRKKREIMTLAANWIANVMYCPETDQNAARRMDTAQAAVVCEVSAAGLVLSNLPARRIARKGAPK